MSQRLIVPHLRAFLCELPDGAPLPSMSKIAQLLPMGVGASAYSVAGSMTSLEQSGEIEMRHGSRSAARGHYIVRIKANGRVHQTEGCPLTFDS